LIGIVEYRAAGPAFRRRFYWRAERRKPPGDVSRGQFDCLTCAASTRGLRRWAPLEAL